MPNDKELQDLGFIREPHDSEISDLGFVRETTPKKEDLVDKAIGVGKKIASYHPWAGIYNLIANKPAENDVQAGVRGLAQGATLGYGDELIGAGHAAVGALQGKDAGDEYINARDTSRQLNAEAANASPIAYHGSEFAGGMAIPGLGNLGSAAKGASILSKIARGVATGAATGALGAGGYSEASTPEELGKDVAVGGAIGGTLGGAIPAVGSAVGATGRFLGDKLSNTPFESVNRVVKPLMKGLEGENLSLDVQKQKLQEGTEEFGKHIAKQLKGLKNQYDTLLTDFANSGGTIDLAERANTIENNALHLLKDTTDPETINEINKVRQTVSRYIKKPEVPQESLGGLITKESTSVSGDKAKELESTLNNFNRLKELKTNTGQNFAREAKEGISEDLLAIPGIKENNTKYRKMSDAAKRLGLKLEDLVDENGNTKDKTFDKLLSKITASGKDGETEIKASRRLENMFTDLDNVDPNIRKQFQDKLANTTENYALAKDLSGISPLAGGFTNILEGGIKATGKFTNILGLAGNKIAANAPSVATPIIEQAAKPAQLSEATYKLDNSQLSGLAQQLSSHPTLKGDGTQLQRALESKNTVSKNAALFNLLQKQEGRDALRSMVK